MHPGGVLRRAAAVVVAALAAGVALLALAAPASAHAQLVRSDPADGANLASSPAAVAVDLTQAVVPERATRRLMDATGRVTVLAPVVRPTAAQDGGPGLVARPGEAGEPTTISAAVPALARGAYRLEWRTLSADDLHVTSGVVVFGVGTDVTGTGGAVRDPLPAPGAVALRWAAFLAAAFAAGGLGVALAASTLAPAAMTPAAAARVRGRVLRWAVAGAGSGAVLSAAGLLVATGSTAVAVRTLTTGYGPAHAVRIGSLVGAALLAARPPRPARALRAGLVLLAGYAVATALTGHVRTEGGAVATAADALHVAAALVWVGLVAVLALLLRAGLPGTVVHPLVRRVGAVATGCLAVMCGSGLLLASGGLASVDALLLSTYGAFVTAKLLLLAVLLVVAGVTASRAGAAGGTGRAGRAAVAVLGRVAGRAVVARVPLRRLVAVEAVVLAALVGVGAAAASCRPAVGTEWVPASAAVPLVSGRTADLVETLAVSPNRPGRTFLTVDVFQTRRPAPGPVRALWVEALAPDGRRARVDALPQGDRSAAAAGAATPDALAEAGRWLATTDVLDEAGRWRLTVVVARAGLPDVRADYDWTVVDPGARLARPLVSSAPLRPVLLGLAALVALGSAAAAVRAGRRRRVPGPPPGAGPGPDDAGPGEREADGHLVRWASQDGTVAVR